jgi:hypothetical protein
MKQFETKNSRKSQRILSCLLCDYNTSNKSDFTKHLSTQKHLVAQNETNMKQNIVTNCDKSQKIAKYICICEQQFNSRSSLWRHKQKCQTPEQINNNDITDDKSLIIKLLQQNQELQKSLIELSKEKTITNHTNSHNKTFNLQLFLNETCKDALNISEFVSSIKPQLSELENTGRVGYVEGISSIILNRLKSLNTPDRPIHCSDYKRETIYVKDNNEWTKENDDKPLLTKAIKLIANENIKQISNWTKQYPNCTDSDSTKNDLYLKIVSNSMSGSTKDETNKNINKIISNIIKEVIIDKDNI